MPSWLPAGVTETMLPVMSPYHLYSQYVPVGLLLNTRPLTVPDSNQYARDAFTTPEPSKAARERRNEPGTSTSPGGAYSSIETGIGAIPSDASRALKSATLAAMVPAEPDVSWCQVITLGSALLALA